jgi:hypothetical protein
MQLKIEITIRLTEDADDVSIDIDRHIDETQNEKLDSLVAHIREFCYGFRDVKRRLQ